MFCVFTNILQHKYTKKGARGVDPKSVPAEISVARGSTNPSSHEGDTTTQGTSQEEADASRSTSTKRKGDYQEEISNKRAKLGSLVDDAELNHKTALKQLEEARENLVSSIIRDDVTSAQKKTLEDTFKSYDKIVKIAKQNLEIARKNEEEFESGH